MGAAFFGFRPAQTIPCLFDRLGILLDFPQPGLNAAQLFKHGLELRDNAIDFAHSLLLLKYILFSATEET